jgi:hypothetical protein
MICTLLVPSMCIIFFVVGFCALYMLCMIYFVFRWTLCFGFCALWHVSTWFCVGGFYELQLFDMGFCAMCKILCMNMCVSSCVQLQGMTILRQSYWLSLTRYEKWTRVNFLEPNLANFNLSLQAQTMLTTLFKEVKWVGD